MKEQVYQNGFYAMLGMIIGVIITLSVSFNSGTNCKTEIQKDTIVVHDTVYKAKPVAKVLTTAALREELSRQNLSHPSIVLAQAKLETANYTSEVCKNYNNLFGLRRNGKYLRYNHWSESVTAYKKLIQSKYKGGDYYAFLKHIGYAEDPDYIIKVKSLVL